jgi:hypothetical protein
MARPSYGYRNAAGKKIVGTTTLLGILNSSGSSDFLLDWAAKLQREGKNWKEVRNQAGAHGTLLHEMCEKHLPNDPVRPEGVPDEQWEKLRSSYVSLAGWWKREAPKTVLAEEPLVSEKYQYGGTLDGLMEWNGGLWLYDFKTGSQVGAKEVCQMAMYRQLLDECKGLRPCGAVLLHAPTKEPGYMHPVVIQESDLDLAWEVCLHLLAIYRMLPALKAVAD